MRRRNRDLAGALRFSGPELSRRRSVAVRALAAVGLLTFSFLFVLVVGDALGTGLGEALEPPGSVEARLGAEHPGEAVHLAGALGVLAVGASALLGLMVRPRWAGLAIQAAGAALGALAAIFLIGDPDNVGGQAGPVDVMLLMTVVPVFAAVAAARPWREWRRAGPAGPRLLVLATGALPAIAFGVEQALLQRNTWPPLADPHHQSHWYAMAVLALLTVPVVAGAAFAGRGWQVGTTSIALAVLAVAITSLAAPTAASALRTAEAVPALLWGLWLLAETGSGTRAGRSTRRRPSPDPHPERAADRRATN